MGSLEITKLAGKQHNHVIRNIRTRLKTLGEGGKRSFASSYLNEYNKRLPYCELPRQETDTLPPDNKAQLPTEVIDRWQLPAATGFDRPYGASPVSLAAKAPADDKALTMSSLEIAELTGKRPADVMRDIRTMLEALGEGGERRFASSYLSDQNKRISCFNLPRRETDILLTGYSTPMRAAVIDRWRELEAQAAKPAHKVPTSFLEAMKLATELEEKRLVLEHRVSTQAIKIEQDAPKVDFHDAVKVSVNCQTIEQVAKKYGVGRTTLFRFLREKKVLRNAEHSPPYQRFIDSGHFEVEGKEFRKPGGDVISYGKTMVTGKGEIYIGKLLREAGILKDKDVAWIEVGSAIKVTRECSWINHKGEFPLLGMEGIVASYHPEREGDEIQANIPNVGRTVLSLEEVEIVD